MRGIFLIILIFCSNLYAQDIEIVGFDNNPPYSYIEDNNKRKGLYVDILKEAFKNMKGYNLKLTLASPKQAISDVKKGNKLAYFPAYFNSETGYRSMFISNQEIIAFCNRRTANRRTFYNFPDDFKEFKLLIDENIKLNHKNIKLEKSNDILAALTEVAKKRKDCYIGDKLKIMHTYHGLKKDRKFTILPSGNYLREVLTISQEPVFLGISGAENQKDKVSDFLNDFDHAIYHLKTDGTIDRIVKKYINHSSK